MFARLIHQTFRSRIRRNILVSGLANILSMAIGLAFYPVALHYLGFEVYGIWLAVAIVIHLAQLGGIGLAPAVTKRVAESLGVGNVQEAEAAIACGHAFTAPLGMFFSLMVWLFSPSVISMLDLSTSSTQLALDLIPWVGLVSGYAVFAQIAQAALTGAGRADLAAALTTGGRVLFFVVVCSLLASGGGLYALVVGSGSECVAIQITALILLRRQASIRTFRWSLVRKETARGLIAFGTGVLGLNAMQLLLTPLNRLLLARYAGIQSVPVFEIAWGAAFRIRSFLDAALKALLPDISRIHAEGNVGRLAGLIRNSYRLIAYGGIPVYLGLVIVAPFVLPLWLGDSFRPELTTCFRIVLICSFISLVGVPAHHHLLATGRIRLVFVGYALLSGANAVIALILAMMGLLDPRTVCLSLLVGFVLSTAWFIHASRQLISVRALT